MPTVTIDQGKTALPRERQRIFGSLKGENVSPPNSFDPLPEKELKLWEGGDESSSRAEASAHKRITKGTS